MVKRTRGGFEVVGELSHSRSRPEMKSRSIVFKRGQSLMQVRVSRLEGGQTWYTVIPPNSKPRVFASKAALFAAFPAVAKAFPKPKATRPRNVNRPLTPENHFGDSTSKEVRAARLQNLQKAARTFRRRRGSL